MDAAATRIAGPCNVLERLTRAQQTDLLYPSKVERRVSWGTTSKNPHTLTLSLDDDAPSAEIPRE